MIRENKNFDIVPMLMCDFYKISHREQYAPGVTKVFSHLVARSDKFMDSPDGTYIFLGMQRYIKSYLIEYFNNNFFDRNIEDIIDEYKCFISGSMGIEIENVEVDHIVKLHNYGKLPIKIYSVDEGTELKINTPCSMIVNTNPEFYWVTNFLETTLLSELWLPTTSATTARNYYRLAKRYGDMTCDNNSHIKTQFHDFSMRGMGGIESGKLSGIGHLLYFKGSDTIPAGMDIVRYYNGDVKDTISSISGTEHSVMCSYGEDEEIEIFKRLLTEVYPTGYFSVVSDTWDFWKVVSEYLPQLKDIIEARDGKLVIRPDSGCPIKILCGNSWKTTWFDNPKGFQTNCEEKDITHYYTEDGKLLRNNKDSHIISEETNPEEIGLIGMLDKIFGTTYNHKGYKLLADCIGAIYGDSITPERADIIMAVLSSRGYASSNIVFGIGGFTYQYKTRDSLGFAIKSTAIIRDGEFKAIIKHPKTDSSKKSHKGLVNVNPDGSYIDNLSLDEIDYNSEDNLLNLIFDEGKIIKEFKWKRKNK